MRDFLLEIGFEELPARFVDQALQQLGEKVEQKFKAERLTHGKISLYSTPRRLALIVKDLKLKQADLVEEVKGPPKNIAYDEEGNLTRAGQGFLRSQGVSEEAITIKEFQGADYLFATKEVLGKATPIVLESVLEDVIKSLSFPKNMRWGSSDLRFARPLRWIVALLGEEVIPVQVGDVVASNITYGHRQLGVGQLTITTPANYLSSLKANYVLADSAERARLIKGQILRLAETESAHIEDDENLFQEIVNLVEYPTAFCGEFDSEYLQVPAEALITSMKEHQRYFPLQDRSGKLLPKFVGVRNGADNHLENVILGNERVLDARLADAKFFFEEDCKMSLDENLTRLERVVFQEGLGSMGEKVERITRLSGLLADELNYDGTQKTSIIRTAKLAKADLVSQMVFEFPELQGIMGEKYALLQGETESVATGIREHYLPRFAGDVLPASVEGTIVSLADKLDTLVGYFALGRIPTGSQDPFALRRQAQGMVQILLNSGLNISLIRLIDLAAEGYSAVSLNSEHATALVDFFLARLRVLLLDSGYGYDLVDTVMASEDDRLHELVAKVKALKDFRNHSLFSHLTTGFERVANLARKGDITKLNPTVFQAADVAFAENLESLEERYLAQLKVGDYKAALVSLAGFKSTIDAYFEDVMIMVDDEELRQSRLGLLHKAYKVYILYGDFHQIVVN